jgi:pimeloyl-ACP methyl ester carboxylesterase
MRTVFLSRLGLRVLGVSLAVFAGIGATSASYANEEIRIDFGNPASVLPTDWNDGRGIIRSGTITLHSSAGEPTFYGKSTAYQLSTVLPFNTFHEIGYRYPAVDFGYPAEATWDGVYGNTALYGSFQAPKAAFEFRNLDPSVSYSFEFFASVMKDDGYNRDTVYQLIGSNSASARLNATNNTVGRAIVNFVHPDANGVIRIEVYPGPDNTSPQGFYHLASMKVRYANPSVPNPAPSVNAGADQNINVGSTVLSAIGSDDGKILKYEWSQVSGANAYLSPVSATNVSVQGLAPGSYSFKVVATDDRGATGSDSVNVVVKATKNNNWPVVNAGADRAIVLPANSVSLTANASDSDGSIVSYAWSKVSGGAATIASSSSRSTAISGMTAGSYVFTVLVKDNKGGTAQDWVAVNVNPAPESTPTAQPSPTPVAAPVANAAPAVSAGGDQSITLPVNSVSLSASASDPEGSDLVYAWTKLSGGAAILGSPSASDTAVSGLVQGSYVFEVSVTDSAGASAKDQVAVTVNPAPNLIPSVTAGSDRVITLPTNSLTLTANASDSDGSIASYAWAKSSGSTATIASPASASTLIQDLVAGSYVFTVTVRDNDGASKSDSVSVTVNPAPAPSPSPTTATSSSSTSLPAGCDSRMVLAGGAKRKCARYGGSGAGYGYVEFVPNGYEQAASVPLVIFLHGIGEKGTGSTTDLGKIWSTVGPMKWLTNGTQLNMILLSPQHDNGSLWEVDRLEEFVKFAISHYKVDQSRIHFTGLSFGGGGTIAYAGKYPHRLASMSPICAGYYTNNATAAANIVGQGVAVWASHAPGETVAIFNNTTRPFMTNIGKALGDTQDIMTDFGTRTAGEYSTTVVNANWTWKSGQDYTTPSGAAPAYPAAMTVYTNTTSHNVWDRFYGRQQFWDWLATQSR